VIVCNSSDETITRFATRRRDLLTNLLPLTIGVVFLVLVLVSAEILDRQRRRRVGDRPSRVLELREKQNPYIMPMGMRVKPDMTYAGNPDYSLPVPESQDGNEEKNSREY
jgi:hypothetical protein